MAVDSYRIKVCVPAGGAPPLYLDIGGDGNAGSPVVQNASATKQSQLWTLKAVDGESGYFYIKSATGDLYVDCCGGDAATGTAAIVWSFNGGDNQKFKYEVHPTSYGSWFWLKPKHAAGMALTASASSGASGVPIVLQPVSGTDERLQSFKYN